MFIDRIKVSSRLYLGFGMLLVILAGFAVYTVIHMKDIGDKTNMLYLHPYSVTTTALRIENNITRIHSGMKDVALAKTVKALTAAKDNMDEAEALVFEEYKKLKERFLGDKAMVQDAEKLFRDWKPIRDEVISLVQSGDQEEAAAITRGKGAAHVSKINTSMEDLLHFAQGKATGFVEAANSDLDSVLTITYVLTGLALILGLGLAFMIARSVKNPLGMIVGYAREVADGNLDASISTRFGAEFGVAQTSIEDMVDAMKKNQKDISEKMQVLSGILDRIAQVSSQVAVGAGQVSSSSAALSQGATEQAASLEEITSSMTEIGSQAKANAENATIASQLGNQAKDEAEKGNQEMANMIGAMGEINDSSQSIAKIIKVIDEIAFQTNLLALNAAVEAARAGKHGKGFAVVAEEVRNLAGRSARAAQETAQLIEGSIAKVENGSRIADQTSASLDGISKFTAQVADLVAEIAAASNEQAEGVSQVNVGLSQVDQVTQQNTANAEETASASAVMTEQAKNLDNIVAEFNDSRKTQETHVSVRRPEPQPLPTRSVGSVNMERDFETEQVSDSEWGREPFNGDVSPEEVISLDDNEFGKF